MFDDLKFAPWEGRGPRVKYGPNTLFPVLTGDKLLAKLKRQWWLKQIKELVDLPEAHYDSLYGALIRAFAEFVQIIPVAPGARLGGLLGEGLGRSFLALQQVYSEQKQVDPRYAYAVFSAALLVDVSKAFDYYQAIISGEKGEFIAEWLPYKSSMVGLGDYFKLKRYGGAGTRLHQYATALLARVVMPEVAFYWLAEDRKLFNMWLSLLNDDEAGSGGLVLLFRLIQQDFEEKYQGKELFLLEGFKLDTPAHTQAGEDFLAWLQEGIRDGRISVNEADSNIFVVQEGVFIAIDIFRDFISSYSAYRDYTVVYKQFNHLGITKLSGDDYKYGQYFSETPATKGVRAEKSSLFKKGFLSTPQPGPKAEASSFKTGETQRQSGLREGLLIQDPHYVFTESDIPSLARNASATYSAGYLEGLLPILFPEKYLDLKGER